MKRSLTVIIIIAATGLLAAQWIWLPEKPDTSNRAFSEKVNLALRQTGHHLLAIEGDDTSAIPPVKKLEENEFLLKLESSFDYDTLPFILDKAFKEFGINTEYQVALKNCQTGTLVLGYSLYAFENENMPCSGREQEASCYNITVVFPKNTKAAFSYPFLLASFGLLSLLILTQWYFSKTHKREGQYTDDSNSNGLLKIGITAFDFKNQLIEINGVQTTLTYRENKLLHFFAKYPNQVLEREKILSQVWGDEGVIVGRSLDVFVSRLRKILSADTSIKIRNVHGVGYRLEVAK